MSIEFKILKPNEKRVLVRLAGELSMTNVDSFKEDILREIDALSKGTLAIDMSEVSRIDSSGMATLLEFHKRSTGKKLKFEVQNPTTKVKDLLDLTKLSKLFKLEE